VRPVGFGIIVHCMKEAQCIAFSLAVSVKQAEIDGIISSNLELGQ